MDLPANMRRIGRVNCGRITLPNIGQTIKIINVFAQSKCFIYFEWSCSIIKNDDGSFELSNGQIIKLYVDKDYNIVVVDQYSTIVPYTMLPYIGDFDNYLRYENTNIRLDIEKVTRRCVFTAKNGGKTKMAGALFN